MSSNVETNVVSMEFDNSRFEKNVSKTMSSLDKLKDKLNFKNSDKSMKNLQKTANKTDFSVLLASVQSVTHSFSALEIAATTSLVSITNKAINAGQQLVKSLTIDQVTEGWDKYAQKTTAVQTILAAVSEKGQGIEDVTAALERLNWFTDETSYSFTDMVTNIGKFTSQGIDLDKSVTAMQGISTWAAISGQGTNEAARAMYNLAQAIGVGAVKLLDWKSIENANMATEQFKKQAIEAAIALGTLEETSDGTYKVLVKNSENESEELGEGFYKIGDATAYLADSSSEAEFTITQFAQSLSDGWFTSDVLMNVLEGYGSYADGIYEIAKGTDKTTSEIMQDITDLASGAKTLNKDGITNSIYGDYDESVIPKLEEMSKLVGSIGEKSFRVSQEAKTFTEVINSVKDAVSTGWMNTFENLIGNYEEAKVFWTKLANELWDIFAGGAYERNKMLKVWKDYTEGGREDLLDSFWNVFYALQDLAEPLKEAFDEIFPKKTAAELAKMVKKIKDLTSKLKLTEKSAKSIYNAFWSLLSVIKMGSTAVASMATTIYNQLSPAFGYIENKVSNATSILARFVENLSESFETSGTLNNINNAIKTTFDTVKKTVSSSWNEIFPKKESGNDTILADITITLSDLFKDFKIGNKAASDFKTILTGLFTALKIGLNFVSAFRDELKDYADDTVPKVSKRLKNFGIGIYEFVLNVSKALVTLDTVLSNIFDEDGTDFYHQIAKSFRKIIDSVTKLASTILDAINTVSKAFLSGFGIIETYEQLVRGNDEDMEALSVTFTNFANVVDKVCTWIAARIDKVSNFISAFVSSHENEIKGFVSILKGIFKSAGKLFEALMTSGFKLFNALFTLVYNILEVLYKKGYFDKLIDLAVSAIEKITDIIVMLSEFFSETKNIDAFIERVGTIIYSTLSNTYKIGKIVFGLLSGFFGLVEEEEPALYGMSDTVAGSASNLGSLNAAINDTTKKKNKFTSTITKITSAVRKFSDKLGSIDLNSLVDSASSKGKTLRKRITSTIEFIKSKIESIKTTVKGVLDFVKNKFYKVLNWLKSKWSNIYSKFSDEFETLKTSLINIFSADNNDKFTTKIEKSLNSIMEFFGTIWSKILESYGVKKDKSKVKTFFNLLYAIWEKDVVPVLDRIGDWFKKNNLDWVPKILLAIYSAKSVVELLISFRDFVTPLKSIRELLDELGGVMGGIESMFKGLAGRAWLSGIARLIEGIGRFSVLFVVASILMDKYGPTEFKKSFTVMLSIASAILVFLGAFAIILAKISAKVQMFSTDKLSMVSLTGLFIGLSIAMGTILLSILALAGMFKLFEKDQDKLLAAIKAVKEILITIGLVAAVITLVSAIAKPKAILSASLLFATIGFAITSMLIPILALAVLPEDVVNKGWEMTKTIISFLTTMIGVLLIASLFARKGASGLGSALVGLTLAVGLLIIPITILSKVPMETFTDGMVKTMLLMSGIAIVVSVISFFTMFTKASKLAMAGVLAVALTAAVTLFLVPLYLLSKIDTEVFESAFEKLFQISLLLAILVSVVGIVSAISGSALQVSSITVSVVAMTAMIAALAFMSVILGTLDADVLKQGLIAVGAIGLIISAVMLSLAAIGTSGAAGIWSTIGAIIVFAATLVGFMYAIKALDLGSPDEGIIKSLMDIALAFGAFAGISAILSPAAVGIIGISAAFVIFAGGVLLIVKAFEGFAESLDLFKENIKWLAETDYDKPSQNFYDVLTRIASASAVSATSRKRMVEFAKSLKTIGPDIKSFFAEIKDVTVGNAQTIAEVISTLAGINAYNLYNLDNVSNFDFKSAVEPVVMAAIGLNELVENSGIDDENVKTNLTLVGDIYSSFGLMAEGLPEDPDSYWKPFTKVFGKHYDLSGFADEMNTTVSTMIEICRKLNLLLSSDNLSANTINDNMTLVGNIYSSFGLMAKGLPKEPDSYWEPFTKVFGKHYDLSGFAGEINDTLSTMIEICASLNNLLIGETSGNNLSANTINDNMTLVGNIYSSFGLMAKGLPKDPDSYWEPFTKVFGKHYDLSGFADEISETIGSMVVICNSLDGLLIGSDGKPLSSTKITSNNRLINSIYKSFFDIANGLPDDPDAKFKVITGIFGKDYNLTDFAGQMASSIKSIKEFAETVNDINQVPDISKVDKIGFIVEIFSKVANAVSGVVNPETVNALFPGSTKYTLSDFTSEMSKAATQLSDFSKELGKIHDDDFKKSLAFFESLAIIVNAYSYASVNALSMFPTLASKINDMIIKIKDSVVPNLSGIVFPNDWYTRLTYIDDILGLSEKVYNAGFGEKNRYDHLSSFGSDIEGLSKNLKNYYGNVKGIDLTGHETALTMMRELLSFYKEIYNPETDNPLAALFEKVSMSSFGSDIASLGSSLATYYNNVKYIDTKELDTKISDISYQIGEITKATAGVITDEFSSENASVHKNFVEAANEVLRTITGEFTSPNTIYTFYNIGANMIRLMRTGFLEEIDNRNTNTNDGTFTQEVVKRFIDSIINAISERMSEFKTAGQKAAEAFMDGFTSVTVSLNPSASTNSVVNPNNVNSNTSTFAPITDLSGEDFEINLYDTDLSTLNIDDYLDTSLLNNSDDLSKYLTEDGLGIDFTNLIDSDMFDFDSFKMDISDLGINLESISDVLGNNSIMNWFKNNANLSVDKLIEALRSNGFDISVLSSMYPSLTGSLEKLTTSSDEAKKVIGEATGDIKDSASKVVEQIKNSVPLSKVISDGNSPSYSSILTGSASTSSSIASNTSKAINGSGSNSNSSNSTNNNTNINFTQNISTPKSANTSELYRLTNFGIASLKTALT